MEYEDVKPEIAQIIADLKTEVSRLNGQIKQIEYTLMDMFAQVSMQAHRTHDLQGDPDNIAKWSYRDAEAMIKHRNELFKQQGE